MAIYRLVASAVGGLPELLSGGDSQVYRRDDGEIVLGGNEIGYNDNDGHRVTDTIYQILSYATALSLSLSFQWHPTPIPMPSSRHV